MPSFRKILVPTDFSPCAEKAFDYAMRIAEPGAEIVLLHVFAFPYDWYYWEGLELESLKNSVEEYARDRLAKLAFSRKREDIMVSKRLLAKSHVGKSVMVAIGEEQPDVVVMGTKGWTDEAPPMGSVAEQIVRRSQTPILIVPGNAVEIKKSPRILVPLFASEASATALRYGVAMAEALGGRTDILHVVPDNPFGSPFLGNEPIEAGDPLEIEHRLKRISMFVAKHTEPSMHCSVHLDEGDFVVEVADFADAKGIDLVVLARSDASDRLHKAEQIAHIVACPVLVVPAVQDQIPAKFAEVAAPAEAAALAPSK